MSCVWRFGSSRKKQIIKERRERIEEKKRLAEMAERMSAKKLQRMKKVRCLLTKEIEEHVHPPPEILSIDADLSPLSSNSALGDRRRSTARFPYSWTVFCLTVQLINAHGARPASGGPRSVPSSLSLPPLSPVVSFPHVCNDLSSTLLHVMDRKSVSGSSQPEQSARLNIDQGEDFIINFHIVSR